jgi:hypothetical protein
MFFVRIRLIEVISKSLYLKSNLEKDFAAVVYFSEAPSPQAIVFWGGVLCNFTLLEFESSTI